jgi:hypothetical protein
MKTKAIALAALAVFLIAAVPFAFAAEEVTKESYVASVEPICQANTKANERILKNVKAEVRAGELAPAAASFLKAASALKKTWTERSVAGHRVRFTKPRLCRSLI